MNIDDMKQELNSRWGSEIGQLCANILDFMADRSPEQLQMLTFGTLAHAAGKKDFDAALFSAVTILASSDFAALDPHAAFIDDDDEQYEITLSELAEARAEGSFVHPETGLLIKDFEEKIVPYFVPSDRFLRE